MYYQEKAINRNYLSLLSECKAIYKLTPRTTQKKRSD